jgi:hypothetical protein
MKFFVEIKLPKYKNNHFRSLLPEQQQQIGQWLQERTLDVFTLNLEQTRVRLIVSADSQQEVQGLMDSFVTRQFMLKISIEPLMLFDSSANQLPPLVLN